MPDMKECTKPHSLLHSLGGVGLGLVLVALVPSLISNAMTYGLLLFVAAIAGEFLFLKRG